MIYWELFIGFLEVGFFSFGGAYAAIPLIRDAELLFFFIAGFALAVFFDIDIFQILGPA